jgi:hypothetical protein
LNSERSEHELFNKLLRLCPFLVDRLFSDDRTNEDVLYSAESVSRLTFVCPKTTSQSTFPCLHQLSRGVSGARSDDLKTMKVAVIDWITPEGGVLLLPLARNVKTSRGFFHDVTGEHLCPTDYDWKDPA